MQTRCVPYLPTYKSTFYSLKIGPKNRPRLIHGSKTEIKKSSGQICIIIIIIIIIVSYVNKHPLLHDTSYNVFSLIDFKELLSPNVKLNVVDTHWHNSGIKN